MDKVQIFLTPAGEKMAVLPFAEYNRLAALDDGDDDEELKPEVQREIDETLARIKAGTETLFPLGVVKLTCDGVPTIRAWRRHRKLTIAKLAKKLKLSPSYLTQIENGTRKGTLATMRRLAKALGTTLDGLED